MSDSAPEGGDWTPPASAEELSQIIERRLARDRQGRPSDEELTALREKADAYDGLQFEMSSDLEKAVEAARQEERKSGQLGLVRAEFKAAAKGELSAEALKEYLEDVDLSKFLTPKGEVDEEKIARKIAAFKPPAEEKKPPQSTNFGQGRQTPPQTSAREQGAAEAARRFGPRS